MQLWDVTQSQILLKYIILAIKHVILNRFPSKLVEIVCIYKGYHVEVRTNSNRFGPVLFEAVSLSQNAQTATDGPVFCGLVWSGCGLFAVATTGLSNTKGSTVYCYLLYCTVFIQLEGEHPIEDERDQQKRGVSNVSASSQGRNPSPT